MVHGDCGVWNHHGTDGYHYGHGVMFVGFWQRE